jgi:ABC-type amino acid transport substrate-binding protein
MTKKQLLAAAIAATLSSGMIATGTTSVFAADNPPASTEAAAKDQATNKAEDKDFMKVSEDALMSMRNLHSARLAIFNGLPERAQTYVDAAVTRIGMTVKDADKYALDTKAPKADDSYVPFDASLTVMDTFEPTAENAKHIAKANEHLHKGEKKEALEALKSGEIDVAVTTSLVPVKFAKEHIDEAAKLVGEGKYYEANLALKAVDDAVVVETFAIDAVPKTKEKPKTETKSEK